MKTVFFFRHGKSSWANEGISDFDRPLKKRGIVQAKSTANKILLGRGEKPELILSSPAVRAYSTSIVVLNTFRLSIDALILENKLYLAEEREIIKTIKESNNKANSLMIVGHNPGLTIAVNSLTGTHVENIATSMCVKVSYDVDSWSMISASFLSSIEVFIPDIY